jgi:hypothetical protein
MATIKSHTDLEQSKKLAEILPHESADLWWNETKNYPEFIKTYHEYLSVSIPPIPCWSLAALLDIIRKAIGYTLQTTYDKNPKVFIECELGDKPYSIESTEYDNEVDACYDMVLRLNELNLL